jgi:SSS family solute:Na+ symporter
VSLHFLDYLVLAVYGLGIIALSIVVSRRQKTAEDYFVAGRSMPAWAVAMAMMAALISSNTLVAHPATAYKEGLILLLGSFTLPIVLIFVAKVIVPFYRNVVGMSAYEYLGARFGFGSRLYASACFVADRIFDVGATIITTAIPIKVMTGWNYTPVVLCITGFTVIYTMFGGMKTVVWTSVVQGFVFIAAAAVILGRLLLAPEAGPPGAVIAQAWHAGKFSLGNFDLSWNSLFDTTTTTQWLFILAYTTNWARRYIADQHMVQRYLIARTDRDASRAAIWNGLVCVPVWATFMFIGVCLYGYYQASGETPPAIADHVIPLFIMQHMPAGIVGLLLAAILAASMSSISPDINSVATVLTADHVGHFFPKMTDAAKLLCGRIMVALGGGGAALIALLLIPGKGTNSVMENVVTVSAILSGGMLGLFFLGFFTRRATRTGCYTGIIACLLFTAWGTLTGAGHRVVDLGFNFTMHPILLGVFSHVVLFVVGYVTSLLFGGYRPDNVDQLTFRRKNSPAAPGASRPDTPPVATASAS